MRVRISVVDLAQFFKNVEMNFDGSWDELSQSCGVHPRTMRDWRKGKYTIPISVLKKMVRLCGVSMPPFQQELDPYWYVHKGSKLGGHARYKKYGNLGTKEGRRLGGLRSIEANRLAGNKHVFPKPIRIPHLSSKLAEFIGALLGDGGITPYHVTLTLHRIDDKAYAQYLGTLCHELFGVTPAVRIRESYNICTLVVARVNLVSFLHKMGLPIGNKVRQSAAVPLWILKKEAFTKACLRGLMDTDGSFYVDRHVYKDRVYLNGALHFSNHSEPLLDFVKSSLEQLGFHPTQRTKFAIFLRREQEINKYFQIVGSSNPKHLNKYKHYYNQRNGEVPKRS